MTLWTRSRTAFVLGVVVGASALTSIEALLISRANAKARSGFYACQRNIARISVALAIYAQQRNGFFPPSLDTLVHEGLIDTRELRCPVSGKKYLYGLRGLNVKEEEIPVGYLIVMEQGFPHVHFSYADPRQQRPRKQFYAHARGWKYAFMEDWATALEKDPLALAKVLGFPAQLAGAPEEPGVSPSGNALRSSGEEKTCWSEEQSH